MGNNENWKSDSVSYYPVPCEKCKKYIHISEINHRETCKRIVLEKDILEEFCPDTPIAKTGRMIRDDDMRAYSCLCTTQESCIKHRKDKK